MSGHGTGASDVSAWLDAREPRPPAELRAHMDGVLAACGRESGSVVTQLGEAALHSLAAAIEQCDDRAAAIDLLAADALLTYAMEAASEIGGEAVEAAAQAYGGGRVAALIPEIS